MTSTSPYKKLKTQNSSYVGYINMIQLEPHKPYKIFDLKESNHEQYGPGLLAYLQGHKNQKWRVQLPSKYLQKLDKDDIEVLKRDIEKKNNPFLVFREKMPDKSYRMDIVETSSELNAKFGNWEDVGELPTSADCTLTEENGE